MFLLFATGCIYGVPPSETTKSPTSPPAVDTADTGTSTDTGTILPTDPGSYDSGDPVDTGAAPACAPDVAAILAVRCVETDAALGTSPYSSYTPLDLEFSATVTDVGGVLAAVPGSAGVAYFGKCGATQLHQVRLVDGSGATWTLGWDLDGSSDDDSTDAITVGDDLTVQVTSRFWGYGVDEAFRLSDATGPAVFYESFAYTAPLTDADRGGVAADVEEDEACTINDPERGLVRYRPVTFTGPYGPTELVSGQTGSVTLADRALTLTLAGSEELLSCADGCGGTTWAGWETP